ncbi:molybdate ABC transporter substrate-binding protein [Methyloferula stellata]|uniref:molybdate ABC transporter substrate-binding protein n=1 Tax=Methyloferula stellata TaxID=876270 RepID=UPI00035C2302|nr:molybdate ABC transporter substrate-binding protein [Methyloferula stellata]
MLDWTRRQGLVPLVFAFLALVAPGAFAEQPAGTVAPAAAAGDGPVVFAAASMKTALDAVAATWKTQNGKSVPISYASSAVLAKQIEQGAPADIFISADLVWMDYLDKAKLLKPGTRLNLLGNTLVLIEPADGTSTLKIAPNFDLAGAVGDGKIAVCTIASCPGGIYAKAAFEKLGIWSAVEPKLAQADNIRNALTLVARGEAKFGVVYGTDAKAEPKVKVVDTFPESSHGPIVYPAAIIAGSKNPDATAFLAYMRSQAATKIFLDQGFAILDK